MNAAGAISADVIVPLVVEIVKPETAVDVGCGTGVWANTLELHGITSIGIDGDYVPREELKIEPSQFQAVNIALPFDLARTFDLALCLEVAEHLEESRADTFVMNLVALSPAVLFSAASPKQGGTHHVNEQWLDYWIRRFELHGYTCWDCIRPQIRYRPEVAWIYRQNTVLFLAPNHPALNSVERWSRLQTCVPGDVSFEDVARYILERQASFTETTLSRLNAILWGTLSHKARSAFGLAVGRRRRRSVSNSVSS